MQIRKQCLIPLLSENGAILTTRTVYLAPTGGALLQEYSELTASDTFGCFYARRSEDHGATWSEPRQIAKPVRVEGGTLRRGEFAFLLDEKSGRFYRFFNLAVYPGGDQHTTSVGQYLKIMVEVSEDGGETFSSPRQIVVRGGDERCWAPGVEYGHNSLAISFCQPVFDRKGRILLPARWIPRLDETTRPPIPLEAVCLIGEVGSDGSLEWGASERVSVGRELSSRGLAEPTLAPLEDGRLLMVCRGSNASIPQVPGRKWITLSHDEGESWGAATPFGYDTGELFFSPATGSRLIRSSRNGKLYWIGNILPENPDGNSPRHPLCIAEVDETLPALRKASVREIEGRLPEDTARVQLSNFHVYEDRVSGELVLIMARIFESSETALRSPAYEYRIAVV